MDGLAIDRRERPLGVDLDVLLAVRLRLRE